MYTTANRSNTMQSSVIKMEVGSETQSRNAWLPQHLRMPISMYFIFIIICVITISFFNHTNKQNNKIFAASEQHTEHVEHSTQSQVITNIIQTQNSNQSTSIHVISSRHNGQGQYYEHSPEMVLSSMSDSVTVSPVGKS